MPFSPFLTLAQSKKQAGRDCTFLYSAVDRRSLYEAALDNWNCLKQLEFSSRIVRPVLTSQAL